MNRQLPTLSDVAGRAGVSYATADRVINARGGVSEKSARRVLAAIEELGYVRNVAAANLSQRRTYRFAFVLPEGPNSFFLRFREILEQSRQRLLTDRVEILVEDVATFDAAALAVCLTALEEDPPDGVALVPTDDARVAEAVARLKAKGVAILTLVANAPNVDCDGYVGIDNVVAGRTAGRLLTLSHIGRPGRILPIVGAPTAHDHAERLRGMTEVISGAEAELTCVPAVEGRDLHDLVEREVRRRLDEDSGITAIYSIGAGNAGLIRVLESLGDAARRPVVILHELVAHSRQALRAGLIDLVIDQRPDDEIRLALECLRKLSDRSAYAAPAPIVPTIYLRENLPDAGTPPNRRPTDE